MIHDFNARYLSGILEKNKVTVRSWASDGVQAVGIWETTADRRQRRHPRAPKITF